MNRVISGVYNNPKSPAYLAGANVVYAESKKKNSSVTLKDVQNYLSTQEVYNLHKPIRRRYKRNKVVARGLNTDFQVDLIDLQKIKRYNKGHAYILTCIDVFSRYGWALPIKDKRPPTVLTAFKEILQDGRVPWRVLTDSGNEFKADFRRYLTDEGIEFVFATQPDIKASNVEKYNKTLKGRLWKHFTKTGTFVFLDILPSLVRAINMSKCRVTGFAPADVTYDNEHIVRAKLEDRQPKPKMHKYKVGDRVHITKYKHILSKGYTTNFSTEIFTVVKCLNRSPVVYKLKGQDGEEINGVFYQPELTIAAKRYKR